MKLHVSKMAKGAKTSRTPTLPREKGLPDARNNLVTRHVLLKRAANTTVKPVKASHGTLMQMPMRYELLVVSYWRSSVSKDNGIRALANTSVPPATMSKKMG